LPGPSQAIPCRAHQAGFQPRGKTIFVDKDSTAFATDAGDTCCQAIPGHEFAARIVMRFGAVDESADSWFGKNVCPAFCNLPDSPPAPPLAGRSKCFVRYVHGCSSLFNERLG
jgi:hypothetical protein